MQKGLLEIVRVNNGGMELRFSFSKSLQMRFSSERHHFNLLPEQLGINKGDDVLQDLEC